MTGSGACVFAEFTQQSPAQRVVDQFPKSMRGWLAAGMDKHPLQELAG